MIWKIVFSKFIGVTALTLSILNLGVTDHEFELHFFLMNLTNHWTEFTRWMLSALDHVNFFDVWSYEEKEKDMTSAHLVALSPAIYYARHINIRLSICGIAYILLYAYVFGTSPPDGPDNSALQGIYRVLGMLIFTTFMFWLLSEKYRKEGSVSSKEAAKLILKIWENAIAAFILILTLSFAGLVSVASVAT